MNEQSDILPASGQLPDIDALLAVIRTMVGEVHPKWKYVRFTPHTLLERELGLDSIARMELLTRIERLFNVSLDEKTAVCAYTPHELMQVIIAQGSGGRMHGPARTETINVLQNDPGTLLMGGYGDHVPVPAARRRWQNTLIDRFYGVYAWLVVLVLSVPAWLLMVFTPVRRWRTRIARTCTRLLFKCTFTPFTVTGHEYLDSGKPMIVVANHTGYLDGFIPHRRTGNAYSLHRQGRIVTAAACTPDPAALWRRVR